MIPFNKILVFASLSPQSSLFETLRFQTVGFILVMVALGLIALILISMGYFFKNTINQKRTTATGASSHEKPTDAVQEDPHELLAVIAAAVDSVIKNSHRIVSIRPVDTGQASGELYLQAWSIEGRRQHFASHKIR